MKRYLAICAVCLAICVGCGQHPRPATEPRVEQKAGGCHQNKDGSWTCPYKQKQARNDEGMVQ